MNKMDTRTLLLILAAVVGFAIINFGVELTASDVGDWLKSTFGEGYKKLLFVALLSCIFIAAAWPYFFQKRRSPNCRRPARHAFFQRKPTAVWAMPNGSFGKRKRLSPSNFWKK
jgi:hypothetical protein